MQTFLTYSDFVQSACCLDNRRLNKQIVEATQILEKQWPYHPATKMWDGYGAALIQYGLACYDEWQRRFDAGERGGKRDHKSGEKLRRYWASHNGAVLTPPWIGNEDFHSRHRAVLLAKNYEWYSQFGWSEKPAEQVDGRWPYIWPV